jgi:hypothetical protein
MQRLCDRPFVLHQDGGPPEGPFTIHLVRQGSAVSFQLTDSLRSPPRFCWEKMLASELDEGSQLWGALEAAVLDLEKALEVFHKRLTRFTATSSEKTDLPCLAEALQESVFISRGHGVERPSDHDTAVSEIRRLHSLICS